jgi:hypothetical protein
MAGDHIYRAEWHFHYSIYVSVEASDEADAIEKARAIPQDRSGLWDVNYTREWVQVVEHGSPMPTLPLKFDAPQQNTVTHAKGDVTCAWLVFEEEFKVLTRDIFGENLSEAQARLEKDRGDQKEWRLSVNEKRIWAD